MNVLAILFLICLVVLAWHWHFKPALKRAETARLPANPHPKDSNPEPDGTPEYLTEPAFLKRLIAENNAGEGSRQLQDGLRQSERDRACLQRALFFMQVLFLVAAAGLGYCAILLPYVFRNPEHLVTRVLSYLCLGSLFSQAAFIGCLLWKRGADRRLHRQCRRLILDRARRQPTLPSAWVPVKADSLSTGGFFESSPPTSGRDPA